jgi:hypothetical protein
MSRTCPIAWSEALIKASGLVQFTFEAFVKGEKD